MNSLKVWLHALVAAAISGAAGSGVAYFAAPQAFNFSHDGLLALGKVFTLGAILPTLAYLKQSPVPALTVTSKTTDEKTVEITKQ
jgi:hypothetical protein